MDEGGVWIGVGRNVGTGIPGRQVVETTERQLTLWDTSVGVVRDVLVWRRVNRIIRQGTSDTALCAYAGDRNCLNVSGR
ncbi:hypothetical protein D3C87_1303420 [compost metagenome]